MLKGDHRGCTGVWCEALVELVDMAGDARRLERGVQVQGKAGTVAGGVESPLVELGCRQPEGVEGAASLLSGCLASETFSNERFGALRFTQFGEGDAGVHDEFRLVKVADPRRGFGLMPPCLFVGVP
ncbi:hypothetical protein DB35_03695 [Streptomyces abyssalis]|uniref:Uncharacterized protein n=1 Tax=Streptomyces abyssalis TaxID=933944 RepID=A0A1E7JQ47_9ACTN|nr:hypothetical protein AN215_12810 [Streptomyces abyssalis]OEU95101.1 hypothetical protein DB35_03695 [Streptomyces abyssalis]OEV31969.1 hypothetical protein AN219_01625 [Streptomyces nanshensis]